MRTLSPWAPSNLREDAGEERTFSSGEARGRHPGIPLPLTPPSSLFPGATNAKASVVRDDGELISFSSEPLTDYTDKGVVDTLVKVATTAVENAGLKFTDVCEIGVGSPGTIDFDVRICFIVQTRRTEWLLRLRTSQPGIMCLLPS